MIYDKLSVLLLSTIAVEKNDSVNSIIARAILDHPEYIQTLGIRDMASYCHVGVSTLSRFCRAIGLEDFYELRDLIQKTDFSENVNTTDAQSHVSLVQQALINAADSVSSEQLDQLCHQLHTAESIAAFGLLKAMSAAISFQTDMSMQRKAVYTNLAFSEQMNYIRNAGPNDLVLLFSYTGSYFEALTEHLNLSALVPHIWIICGQEPLSRPVKAQVLHFQSDGSRDGHPYQLLMISDLIVRRYAELYPLPHLENNL